MQTLSRTQLILGVCALAILAGLGVWYWLGASVQQSTSSFIPYDGTSFYYKGQPISPQCLDFGGIAKGGGIREGETVDLSKCSDLNLKIVVSTSTSLLKSGESFSVAYPQVSGDIFSSGNDVYEIVGQRGNEYLIVGVSNGGGSGYFTGLALFERKGDSLILKWQSENNGERCAGGIANVELGPDSVLVGRNLTPVDMIDLVSSSTDVTDLQLKDGLGGSARDCYAIAHDSVNFDTGTSSLQYVELTIPASDLTREVRDGSYQYCFDQEYADYVAGGVTRFSLPQLKMFADTFFAGCNVNNVPAVTPLSHGLQTYTNTKYGFSFKYPLSLPKLTEYPGGSMECKKQDGLGDNTALNSVVVAESNGNQFYVTVTCEPLTNAQTVYPAEDDQHVATKSIINGITVYSHEWTNAAGYSWKVLQFALDATHYAEIAYTIKGSPVPPDIELTSSDWDNITSSIKVSTNSQMSSLSGKSYSYHQLGQNPFDAKDRTPYSFFDFSLDFATTTGDNMSGWWFGAWHNANRVNGCFKDDEPCFQGIANGNTALVTFNGCYAEGQGEARITYDETHDTIDWEITKKPQGECYVPDKATLTRDN